VATLIHLNGPPGVGKSTLAGRYAAGHPGTLLCDPDRLRTLIGGWEEYAEAAGLIRTAALAMMTAHLQTGHDVVVPQRVAVRAQLERFRLAARAAGARYVGVMLTADPDTVVARFRTRDAGSDDAWTRWVGREVEEQGGDDVLLRGHAELEALAGSDPSIHRLPSTDLETTYAGLLALLRD
jgi:predicted kinase